MNLAILTGVSRGLGKSLLLEIYSRTDYQIMGFVRSLKTIPIKDESRIFYHEIDLSNSLKLSELLSKLNITPYKKIVFINNAGVITPIAKIGRLNTSDLIKNVQVNFLAPTIIANQLKAKTSSLSIVNISSGAANHPIEGWSLYGSCKAGAALFFQTFQKENPESKVLQIDPGIMDTAMQKDIRGVNQNDFPRLQEFIKFKEDSKLKSPALVAKNILNELVEKKVITQ